MNDNKQSSRHEQALNIATTLVEDIRLFTRTLPEEEDMVMVPAIRESVMDLHKATMMLAHGTQDEADFQCYTNDVFGKAARLRIQLSMCTDLQYMEQHRWEFFDNILTKIESLVVLPKKPTLSLVT